MCKFAKVEKIHYNSIDMIKILGKINHKGDMMKIITICGSLKFIEEMKYYAEKLELEGNCVLSVLYPTKDKENYTPEEIQFLQMGHYKKIDISDAIFVVNINGYIGEAVKAEIEYAKIKNKEIIYCDNTVC
jgi:hypothetical protein